MTPFYLSFQDEAVKALTKSISNKNVLCHTDTTLAVLWAARNRKNISNLGSIKRVIRVCNYVGQNIDRECLNSMHQMKEEYR